MGQRRGAGRQYPFVCTHTKGRRQTKKRRHPSDPRRDSKSHDIPIDAFRRSSPRLTIGVIIDAVHAAPARGVVIRKAQADILEGRPLVRMMRPLAHPTPCTISAASVTNARVTLKRDNASEPTRWPARVKVRNRLRDATPWSRARRTSPCQRRTREPGPPEPDATEGPRGRERTCAARTDGVCGHL